MELEKFFASYDEVPNQRSAQFSDLDVTETKNGDYLFDGYAAVFDEITDLGDFTEEVRRGTFRKALVAGYNVPFLHEHKPEYLLASTKSGRLRLLEETRGLRTMATLVRTDLSERVKSLYDSGDITGMSFGFICGAGNSEHTSRNGKPHRIIKNLKRLLDVTTTWDPAYASAEAQFRTMALARPEASKLAQPIMLGTYPVQQHEDGAQKDEEQAFWEEPETEEPPSGVSEEAPLLAARKRRLELLSRTLEGGD